MYYHQIHVKMKALFRIREYLNFNQIHVKMNALFRIREYLDFKQAKIFVDAYIILNPFMPNNEKWSNIL